MDVFLTFQCFSELFSLYLQKSKLLICLNKTFGNFTVNTIAWKRQEKHCSRETVEIIEPLTLGSHGN